MGIFSFLFNNQKVEEKGDITLYSPVTGTLIPISDVPDIVISERVIGDGVALYPDSDTIVAPCDGTITRILATNSAFAIKEEHGVEIYFSFGIGAYDLSGSGFASCAKIGDKVKKGDAILKVDLPLVNERIKSLVSSLIVVKSSGLVEKVTQATGRCEAAVTPVAFITLKDNVPRN